jgi:FtsP/CotA-like multicopper oxidase with cupredoxin domain
MSAIELGSVNRRRMLGRLGLLGAGAAVAASAPVSLHVETGSRSTYASGSESHDMSALTSTASNQAEMTNDEMDAMHESGVKSFPARTAGLGGQPLEFEMDGDVKVFQITCQEVKWEFAPGQFADAMAYNGVVPGPEIRVTEGDKVRIVVTNEMTHSTAVHFHGLMVPNSMDGVPFITQPPIKPGASFTYEFQIREDNAGSHMYHSHLNAAEQVTKGLLGPFIVEPRDPSTRPAYDVEYTMVLNDGPIGGFSLNGKSFPATQPLVTKKGQRVLVRFMNEGLMIHPMHLHGMPMTVIARDGYLLPTPYMCDTLEVDPGQRTDVLIEATELGVWAFHCHVLHHAEGPTGMFGMVTALIVEA